MRYEIHVAGPLPLDEVRRDLEPLAQHAVVARREDTVLRGEFADEAALHAFLHRLCAGRACLVRVRRRARHPT